MTSKTRMLELVKDFAWREVAAGLDESPDLLAFRGDKGRNWLHICCGSPLTPKRNAADSIKTADVLLARGIDIDQEAFREEEWRATPVWFAVARGRNLALAEHLLKLGANPNYTLFAASFARDHAAIELLMAHGADIEDVAEDESPFLGAVKYSHFPEAELFLRHGANIDKQDSKGMTALHYMLKKGSDLRHFQMLARHGARGDIPNADGQTAVDILRRKKHPAFRALADQLRTG
jgi:ankyrin repeat protein